MYVARRILVHTLSFTINDDTMLFGLVIVTPPPRILLVSSCFPSSLLVLHLGRAQAGQGKKLLMSGPGYIYRLRRLPRSAGVARL